MGLARSKHDWARTAEVLNLIHNVNLGPKGRPTQAYQWNPHGERPKRSRRGNISVGDLVDMMDREESCGLGERDQSR